MHTHLVIGVCLHVCVCVSVCVCVWGGVHQVLGSLFIHML